jgi:hypothetical protein
MVPVAWRVGHGWYEAFGSLRWEDADSVLAGEAFGCLVRVSLADEGQRCKESREVIVQGLNPW